MRTVNAQEEKAFENIVRKEKMLVTSIFSFFISLSKTGHM